MCSLRLTAVLQCLQGSNQIIDASSQYCVWYAGLLCAQLWQPQRSSSRAETCQDQFDAKVYGIVIQSLVEEPGPLPTLFMRTVIQVVERFSLLVQWKYRTGPPFPFAARTKVKELPRLSDFIVMEILPRLVRQEVWGDENMWLGT